MRWPIFTLVGITAAVLIGLVHASLERVEDCLFGENDLAPRYSTGERVPDVDPLGGDWGS